MNNADQNDYNRRVVSYHPSQVGHAEVRARCGGHAAWFSCPGAGDSAYCFSRAEDAARAAGFEPVPAERGMVPWTAAGPR